MTDPATLYEITPPAQAREYVGGVRARLVRAGWFRPDAGGFFGVVPQPRGRGWSTPMSAAVSPAV